MNRVSPGASRQATGKEKRGGGGDATPVAEKDPAQLYLSRSGEVGADRQGEAVEMTGGKGEENIVPLAAGMPDAGAAFTGKTPGQTDDLRVGIVFE